MKSTLEKVNTISQAVKVELTAEEMQRAREKAYQKLAKDVRVPGFRKGKVPPVLIEQRLGKEVDREAIEQAVRESYPQALREVNARPLSDPHVEPGAYVQNAPFEYKAVFEVFPEAPEVNIKGLTLTREKFQVTDAEVDAELSALQRRMTQLEPAAEGEGLVEGMLALIDFTGTADGKEFDGSKAENFVVDFGAGNMLPEFEQQLRGVTSGEKREISFTYPADYFKPEVAGKSAKFSIHVRELRRKHVPELNDEFAKSLGNYENLDKVKQDIRHRIMQLKEHQSRNKLHRQVVDQLCERHPIDIPHALITAELSSMLDQLHRQLQQQGMTLEQAGVDAKTFVSTNHPEALQRARGFVLLQAVVKAHELAATDEEIDARITQIAQSSNQPEAAVRAHIEKERLRPRLETELLLEKALDFIVSKSKIKEVEPEKAAKNKK